MTTEEMLVSLVENVKNINSTLNNMNKQFDDVNSKINNMNSQIEDINNQISEMKTDIQNLKSETREISLTLENETNRNIKIIAEGHLDLSRKLDKALTVENEKEMALI